MRVIFHLTWFLITILQLNTFLKFNTFYRILQLKSPAILQGFYSTNLYLIKLPQSSASFLF